MQSWLQQGMRALRLAGGAAGLLRGAQQVVTRPRLVAPAQAITTLLKTGNESSIDRLLKQIGGFMGEIADEFKVVVVEAIKALCLKFPQVRCACPSSAGLSAASRSTCMHTPPHPPHASPGARP
jgi:hypothetical protein